MKAVVEGHNGFILKNITITLRPWEKIRFGFCENEAKGGLMQNCTVIHQSWKTWFLSLFRRKFDV